MNAYEHQERMRTTKNIGLHHDRWQDRSIWMWCAIAVWTLAMLVIAIGVFRRDFGDRSLAMCYEAAVCAWRQGEDLYYTPTEFLYPPSFVLLYWPFEVLPRPIGEIAWRVITAAGIAMLLYQMMVCLNPKRSRFDYLLLTLVTIPVSLGAIQMGQANAAIALCLFGATYALMSTSMWGVSICLALAIAIKPIALAPIGLLLSLLSLRITTKLIPCVVLALALPFLTAPIGYVSEQMMIYWGVLTGHCVQVSEHRFADINGLLRTIGIPMVGTVSLAVRAGVGIVLACVVFTCRHRIDRAPRALFWLVISASYLMLFNPMTEANSYCILAVPMALYALSWIESGKAALGWGTFGVLVVMGIGSEVFRPIFGNRFDLAVLPLATIVFLSIVVTLMLFSFDHIRPEKQLANAIDAE